MKFGTRDEWMIEKAKSNHNGIRMYMAAQEEEESAKCGNLALEFLCKTFLRLHRPVSRLDGQFS
jgi:hypothetical protein